MSTGKKTRGCTVKCEPVTRKILDLTKLKLRLLRDIANEVEQDLGIL